MKKYDLDDQDFEMKDYLVTWMTIVHGVCFLILATVERKMVQDYFDRKQWNTLWIETLSRYTNIYMNQGLFFQLAHFFLYTIIPKKMDERAIDRSEGSLLLMILIF